MAFLRGVHCIHRGADSHRVSLYSNFPHHRSVLDPRLHAMDKKSHGKTATPMSRRSVTYSIAPTFDTALFVLRRLAVSAIHIEPLQTTY